MPDQNEISLRHQDEWQKFHKAYLDGDYSEIKLEDVKVAKELAATLKTYQEGERKAYGFGEGTADSQIELGWDDGKE